MAHAELKLALPDRLGGVPERFLDVDELKRRMAGRITIAPNRLKMRRQGESWQSDLLQLLDEMADLYESGRSTVAVPGH